MKNILAILALFVCVNICLGVRLKTLNDQWLLQHRPWLHQLQEETIDVMKRKGESVYMQRVVQLKCECMLRQMDEVQKMLLSNSMLTNADAMNTLYESRNKQMTIKTTDEGFTLSSWDKFEMYYNLMTQSNFRNYAVWDLVYGVDKAYWENSILPFVKSEREKLDNELWKLHCVRAQQLQKDELDDMKREGKTEYEQLVVQLEHNYMLQQIDKVQELLLKHTYMPKSEVERLRKYLDSELSLNIPARQILHRYYNLMTQPLYLRDGVCGVWDRVTSKED
jgi:hypothetical protein